MHDFTFTQISWRSWNAYHNDVTQAKMEAVMDAMVKPHDGVSIKDLGFITCGLDDNWQAVSAPFQPQR